MDRSAIRLAIVAPGLRCGGVERSVTTTASELARRGYRVTVLTYDDSRSDFFSLPPDVVRVPLGLRSKPAPPAQLIQRMYVTLRTLRAALRACDPHVVITHMARINVHTLMALKGLRVPIIVTEHGDVQPGHWRKSFWYRARRFWYRSAFRLVSVSHAVDSSFAWLPAERRTVIPNPVAVREPRAESAPAARNDIVAVGRLSHAKGFDILISAYAQVAARFSRWRLVVIGEGEQRAALERQARALGLSERILFTGAIADPTWFLRRARLFVMASRFEGFPLAHAEALACGLPVIATDCPSRPLARGEQFVAGGIRELVHTDVNGLLVPPCDPAALAQAMAALISDPERRAALALHAPSVRSRLAPDRIADAWDQLIEQALSHSQAAPPRKKAPCVVITGPVNGAISGIATHVGLLAGALQDRITAVHFPIGGEGRKESMVGRALRLVGAPLRLGLLVRRRRPAVVHINTSLTWRACVRDALIVATCRLCQQPFVLQFHGGRTPAAQALNARVGRKLLGRLLRLPERVVAISREDEAFYGSLAPHDRVVRIPNGVAVKEPAVTARSRFAAGRLRLLHCGRLAEDKGLLDILDALALMRRTGPLEQLSLVIAGTGPLLTVARRRVESHRLGDVVRFVGAAFGTEKEVLLANADLFVLPTYHPERLPYALLESMAAGVVPVTCRAGAIGDLVRDGHEGFLVKPRDPQGLATLFAALLRDPAPLPRLSAACRETIRASYSLERMANAFEALYAEVGTAPLAVRLPGTRSVDRSTSPTA